MGKICNPCVTNGFRPVHNPVHDVHNFCQLTQEIRLLLTLWGEGNMTVFLQKKGLPTQWIPFPQEPLKSAKELLFRELTFCL